MAGSGGLQGSNLSSNLNYTALDVGPSSTRIRLADAVGSRAGVLVVWVQFVGLLAYGIIQTWQYYGSSVGLPGWLAGLMVVLVCLNNLCIWLSFCYIVVGKSVMYIPIYLVLLALAVGASLGDFIQIIHMVDHAISTPSA